jgi:glyoxylate/hydroxypyruvate reductase A
LGDNAAELLMSVVPALAVHSDGEPSDVWVKAFRRVLPKWTIVGSESIAPDVAERVEAVVIWAPPPGFLGQFPRLRKIVSIGAGLDHLASDPSRPLHVPVVPRRDPVSIRAMAEFVLMQTLIHHRRIGDAIADRSAKLWRPELRGPLGGLPVSVLGQGPMGRASAELLAQFGCKVVGWSRSPRPNATVPVRSGWSELDSIFSIAQILINMLPSTPETRGLIDDRRLRLLPSGAGLINVGRADALDQAALIRHLDSGALALASLDVTAVEPPNPSDPVWRHPRILLTPHIASLPDPAAFAEWAAAEALS